MTTTEIIFLIIAIGFIVLVFFLALVAVSLFKMIFKITEFFGSLIKQVESFDHEPQKILHNVNEISANLDHKLKCFDPLFHSISNLGEGLEYSTCRYKEDKILRGLAERLYEKKDESKMNTVAEAIDLVQRGIHLFNKMKKRS